VDEAVLSPVPGQRGAAAAVRPGLQPGQLPAAVGTPQAGPGLDADDAAGEADQDRRQGGGPRQVRRLPTGGSRRPAGAVRGTAAPDRAAATGVRLGVSDAGPRETHPTGGRRASAVRQVGRVRYRRGGAEAGSVSADTIGRSSVDRPGGKIVADGRSRG
jgi:hypothetical protein